MTFFNRFHMNHWGRSLLPVKQNDCRWKWLLQNGCKWCMLRCYPIPYRWFPEGVCHCINNQRDTSLTLLSPRNSCLCHVSAYESNTRFLICLSFHLPPVIFLSPFYLALLPAFHSTYLSLSLLSSASLLLLYKCASALYFGVSCEIQLLLSHCSLQCCWMFKRMQMLHALLVFAYNLYGGGHFSYISFQRISVLHCL